MILNVFLYDSNYNYFIIITIIIIIIIILEVGPQFLNVAFFSKYSQKFI